jgi:hypothetical protein
MATTYEKIATTTLGDNSSSFYFENIPATYTDLRIVITGRSTANGVNLLTTFNGDSGSSNYSNTMLRGNGTTASSQRLTNFGYFNILQAGFHTTNTHLFTIDVFSYAASIFKTCLFTASEDNNGSGSILHQVGLWRSTSAITSVAFETNTEQMLAGTTTTLYGILKA